MSFKRFIFITFILSSLISSPVIAKELNWVGCGITKKAFMSQLASAYELKTGIRINLEGGGATKGILSTQNMTAHMGGSCRYKQEGTIESSVRLVPVAWDALVAITHKSNPVKNLSLIQLSSILTGKITNWKEVGGPDAKIQVFIRKSKISGVGHALRDLLFRNPDQEFISDKIFSYSGPLEKSIETSVHAIGVSGVSSAKKRDLNILNLEGREPSYQNIAEGQYLLYRPLYLAVKMTHPEYREIKKFLNFALSSDGRKVIRHAGTVPYYDAMQLVSKTWKQNRGDLL